MSTIQSNSKIEQYKDELDRKRAQFNPYEQALPKINSFSKQ